MIFAYQSEFAQTYKYIVLVGTSEIRFCLMAAFKDLSINVYNFENFVGSYSILIRCFTPNIIVATIAGRPIPAPKSTNTISFY